jgi:hypothetical protein
VIANIVSDLFEAAESWKVSDGISENSMTLERKACGKAGHVLLGDTDIENLPGIASDEIVQDSEA